MWWWLVVGGKRGLCGWCNWGGVLWSELTAGGIGLCTPANVAQKLEEKKKCAKLCGKYKFVLWILGEH